MKFPFTLLPSIVLALICQPDVTKFSGQQNREIKALSETEITGYLEGRGMGFAKAAELNGYPGPAHVLELADELALTPKQRARAQALKDSMKNAASLGARLVDTERRLEHALCPRRSNGPRSYLASRKDRPATSRDTSRAPPCSPPDA